MRAGGVPPLRVKVGVLPYRVKPTQHLAVRAHNAVKVKAMVENATDAAGVYHEDAVIEILGLTNPDEQIILVESVDAGPDVQRVTLLHEITHAILSQAGMRDTLSQEQEESLVKRLAPLLLQVLQDNPKLVKYLTGRWNDRKVVL